MLYSAGPPNQNKRPKYQFLKNNLETWNLSGYHLKTATLYLKMLHELLFALNGHHGMVFILQDEKFKVIKAIDF